jgi:hypothetical protein
MSDASSSEPGAHYEHTGKARNVVQAGAIHGGMHVHPPAHAPASAPPVPQQIPLDVPYFTGRAAALAELDALVLGEKRGRIAAIAGPAGVGKTALAVHWAHRVRDRLPEGSLYVNLRGFDPGPPKSPQEALEGFLRGEAWALVHLGDAWRDMAKPDEARECWHRALTMLEELGISRTDEVRARLRSS